MLLGVGASVTLLDSEAAVIAAGLKAKHTGKQLFRVATGKSEGEVPIVMEADSPQARQPPGRGYPPTPRFISLRTFSDAPPLAAPLQRRSCRLP